MGALAMPIRSPLCSYSARPVDLPFTLTSVTTVFLPSPFLLTVRLLVDSKKASAQTYTLWVPRMGSPWYLEGFCPPECSLP